MKLQLLRAIGFSVCVFTGYSQQIIQLGVYNNNPNFVNKYYLNKSITSTISGVRFIDFSVPGSPTVTATMLNPYSAFPMAMEISGNYLYLGGGSTGYFAIADISNINAPFVTGKLANISGTGYRIALSGNYAFMPTNNDTLHAIDISNKNSPVIVKKLYTGGQSIGIAIKGNYAYVGTNVGIKIVDISSPSTMSIAATVPGGYGDLVSDLPNNKLYVASSLGVGFDVLDITSPLSPVYLFSGTGGASGGSLEFRNGFVFQRSSTNSVCAFKINPTSANYLCSFPTSNGVNSISAKDSVFFVSATNNVYCLRLSLVTGIQEIGSVKDVSQIYPNPGNGLYDFQISSDVKDGELTIFDIHGTEVCKQITKAGINQMNISTIPPGIYSYLITGNEKIISKGKLIKE